ncbi:MAG: triose-phosphate isomerase [Pseudomonadota bacterium]
MRKPFIAANWKLNNTVPEALKFVAAFTADLKSASGVDVVIAPPFTALYSMGIALADTEFKLAAQNLFWEDSGAYTGEIAGPFLNDVGCSYAIVGHSERRQYFGETDVMVNKRLKAALRNDLVPIMCVGETLEQREANKTWDIISEQLRDGLKGIDLSELGDFVIAYEPVWAIGTGKTATPDQAQEVHGLVRNYLGKAYGGETAARLRLLYGGSVKPSNGRELLSKEDIDGALVGGASLKPDQFAAIVRCAH